MIARKFPQLTVAVCEDRVKGVNRLMQSVQPPEVVALDDVYQHRHIMPKLNILLTEYGDPFCDDHILPFGNLRESRRGRRRADIVVVTKCPDQLTESEQQQIRRRLKISDKQQLFFSHIEYGEPVSLFGEATMDGCEDVVLVTGIAHPEPLVKYLERKYKVHHLRFSDHHSFDEADYRKIEDAYNSLGGSRKAVVTTEKDAARMMNGERLCSLPVFYIPIEVKIQNQSAFDSAVLSAAGQG